MLFVLAPASSRNLHAQQRPVQAWLPGGSVSTPTTNCTPTNEESPCPTETSLRLLLLLPSTWREQLRITRGPVCKVRGASRPRRDIKLGRLRKLMMADKSKRSFTCPLRIRLRSTLRLDEIGEAGAAAALHAVVDVESGCLSLLKPPIHHVRATVLSTERLGRSVPKHPEPPIVVPPTIFRATAKGVGKCSGMGRTASEAWTDG
jgi:hypothetical protein